MKILHVIEDLSRGGAERVIVNTLPELQNVGINCEVAILFQNDDLAEGLEHQGVKVHRLGLSYKWNVFEALYKLYTLVKRGKYDIVHANLFFAHFHVGLLSLFLKNVKTAVTFHNLAFDAYPANTFVKKVRKKIEEFVVKRFDGKIAVSKAVKEHYEKHLHLKSVDVIYNSFPIERIEKYKTDHHAPNERFTILTPGRLVEEKGHRYLFEAINILNQRGYDFEFLVVGKGPLEEYCRAQTQHIKNITLNPELTHPKLMKLYNEVDLIVIPSIYEAFGLVVGEAMIMGVPVVATSVYGIIEIMKNGEEGLKVPPGDPSALADAIEKMYLNEPLRKKFVENAQKKIKQFDIEIIRLKWKAYYEDLLHG